MASDVARWGVARGLKCDFAVLNPWVEEVGAPAGVLAHLGPAVSEAWKAASAEGRMEA